MSWWVVRILGLERALAPSLKNKRAQNSAVQLKDASTNWLKSWKWVNKWVEWGRNSKRQGFCGKSYSCSNVLSKSVSLELLQRCSGAPKIHQTFTGRRWQKELTLRNYRMRLSETTKDTKTLAVSERHSNQSAQHVDRWMKQWMTFPNDLEQL